MCHVLCRTLYVHCYYLWLRCFTTFLVFTGVISPERYLQWIVESRLWCFEILELCSAFSLVFFWRRLSLNHASKWQKSFATQKTCSSLDQFGNIAFRGDCIASGREWRFKHSILLRKAVGKLLLHCCMKLLRVLKYVVAYIGKE